jgi:sulfur carrier protein
MDDQRRSQARQTGGVKVLLRNPKREVEFPGPVSITAVLGRLDLHRESVLVIKGDTLVPGDAMLADDDVIEVRPVISGGSA